MDHALLESVPNVSAGRDVAVVDGLVRATRAGIEQGMRQDGTRAVLADVHRDSDHDRSVFTLVGRGEALAGGLEALARAAVESIDIHDGRGVHPRVGALDVVPVIALEEGAVAQAQAHALVARVAALLGDELEVPTVRYGLDALGEPIDGASHTGAVRRGGPATVADRIRTGEVERLAGPVDPHLTAGVTICGVRDLLVAFNVDLDTDDLDAARAIAARIRSTADGDEALPGIRALGLRLASRRVAQVSTNVERHHEVGPARVLQVVTRLATEQGIGVSAAELVGLAPDTALAALRYASTSAGVPLLAAEQASLETATSQV